MKIKLLIDNALVKQWVTFLSLLLNGYKKSILVPLLLILTSGNIFGQTYTLDLSNQSSAFGTTNSYGNKSGTVNGVQWFINSGSAQSASAVWLGANNAGNRTSFCVLSAGVNGRGTAIASALSSFTGTTITTSTVGYYAIVGANAITNVGSIKVGADTTGGTAPETMWCLYTTNGGTSYTVLGAKSNPGTTEQTFTPTSTIATAQYVFVFYSSSAGTYRTPAFNFYAPVSPTLSAATLGSSITNTYGTASTTGVQTSATGTNITGNITVTPSSGFEVSKTNATTGFSNSAITVTSGTNNIWVRFAATKSAGAYNTTIAAVLSGGGASANANITTSASGNTINKKALTVTAGNQSVTYGTAVASVTGAGTYTLSGFANGESATTVSQLTGGSGTPTYTTTYTATTNAGTAGIIITPVVSGLSATNYSFSPATGTITIGRANTTSVTVTNGSPYTYIPSTPQGPDAVTVVPSASNGAVTYSYSGTENGGIAYGPSATKPTNAGSYSVIATVAQSTNYESLSSSATAFVINRAVSDITVTGDGSYAFNGNPHGPTTYDHTGSTGNVTFEYTGINGTVYAASSNRPTAVGSYKAVATLAADNNYNGAVSDDFNFQITSVAVPEITSALAWSITYGVLASPYTITASNNPTSYSVSGLPGGLSYNSTTHQITGTPNDAPGDYNVTLTATNEGGTSDPATLVITITKKDVTIASPSVANKVYDANNTATLSGTLSGVVGGDDVTLSLSANFDDVNGNVGQDKPVTSTSVLSGTKASYYNLIQPLGLKANITKATPVVTVTGITSYTYNGSAQGPGSSTVNPSAAGTATYLYSGTENGGAAYGPSATKPTNAGSYSVIATVAESSNYTAASSSAYSFTIGKGSQTITGLPTAVTKIYGDADYALSATASSGLTVTYTSSNTDVATVTGNTVKIVGAGNSTITAHQIGNDNFNAATDVNQALTVNPKEITITGLVAENKVYDQTTSVVITGTPVYSGLANGDSFSVTGTVTWAFADKNVGVSKTLVRTGNYNAPSANYTVLQPTLQANITKKDIAITTITANNKAYNGTVTATFSNVTSTDVFAGDAVTFAVSGSFSDANAGEGKPVSILAINLLGTDGGNYNIPLFPTGLTADITKINQTITFNTVPTVNVGGTVNLATYASTTSGLPLSYSSSAPGVASISGATLTGNNMGSTVVTVSQVGNTNYNAASVQQTVNVVELPVALAQWDFFGVTSSASLTTLAATEISPSLNAASAILSRGPGAAGSAGGNSFRTVGFQNNGIAVTNTDYFQTSFTATENILSLTSIRARVIGTSTFTATPGVQIQFAYSLNGTTYTLINSPINFIGDGQIPDMNLAGVTALQNIAAGTTVYFRFYASGRTTTGGYGFSSPASEQYGLEFYGRFKPTTITWNGSAWSNFNGPDRSQNAIIDGAYSQASTTNGLEVNNITVTNNGAVTIQADQGITVNGDITTPDDKITIESDGSLTQTKLTNGNSNNKIIAKRIVNMRTLDYTYWSSPVANQVLLNTTNPNAANSTGGFSQGSPNNRTYEYNEVNDKFVATTDQQFAVAKGYAIRGKSTYGTTLSSDELSFRGNLNNGNYFIQIQKSKNTIVGGVSTEHGYNMIGNPYPSNIDFDKFYNLDNGSVKNSASILGKAWFWTNVPGAPTTQGGSAYVSNNYATYSLAGGVPATGSDEVDSPIPTKFIKVAQGFIVQMRTAAPTGNTADVRTLKFDNSIRSNDSSSYFYNNNKSAESGINRYWLKLVSPYNVVNTILLAHIDGATNDYDADYDSELLTIGDDSFYSKLAAQKLQIQARNNPLSQDDAIKLGTKYSVAGTYKIKLGNKEGVFKTNQKIYLFDKLLNTYIDITSQDYSFTASKGTDENRFEIVYKDNQFLGVDSLTKSSFEVYRDGTDYVITSSKALGEIEVYDVAGRLVIHQKTVNKSIRLDASTLVNGIYIIKAENSGDTRTKKIIK